MHPTRISPIAKVAAILLTALATAGGTAAAADFLPTATSPGCECGQSAPLHVYVALPCPRTDNLCDHLFSRVCCGLYRGPVRYAEIPASFVQPTVCEPQVAAQPCWDGGCASAPPCCGNAAAPCGCTSCAPVSSCCGNCATAAACAPRYYVLKAKVVRCRPAHHHCPTRCCEPCAACGNACLTPAPAADGAVVYSSEMPQGQGVAAAPAAASSLAAMHAAQQADIKSFQQVLERRVANLEAMREMQQAEVNAMASLESVIHQARATVSGTPNSNPTASPAPSAAPAGSPAGGYQAPQNLSSQLDSLHQKIRDLNHAVKTLAEREAAHEWRAEK